MASRYRRGNIYWITYRKHGKKYSQSLKTADLNVAKYKQRQIELSLTEGKNIYPGKKLPISQILPEYIAYMSVKNTPHHTKDQHNKVRNFFKKHDIIYIQQINPVNMQKYLSERKDKGLKSSSLRHDLIAVKSFLNWSAYNGYIENNAISRVKGPRIERKPPRYLTKAEIGKILKYALFHDDLHKMIVISIYTGVRKSELLNIKYKDFDFPKATLTIPKSKSGKFRVIPYNPKINGLIRPVNNPQDAYMFEYKDIPRKLFARILKNAELNITWHVFRHTYASHMIMKGIPLVTVSKLLGHSNIATTMIYAHLSDKHIEEAGKSVEY